MHRCTQSNREGLYAGIVENLRQMPAQLRQVFVLRHYRGYSPAEIAVVTGIQESSVGLLLKQAEALVYQRLRSIRSSEQC
jgi:DNA-directed RNA polymerase specialized sigma24 family protein